MFLIASTITKHVLRCLINNSFTDLVINDTHTLSHGTTYVEKMEEEDYHEWEIEPFRTNDFLLIGQNDAGFSFVELGGDKLILNELINFYEDLIHNGFEFTMNFYGFNVDEMHQIISICHQRIKLKKFIGFCYYEKKGLSIFLKRSNDSLAYTEKDLLEYLEKYDEDFIKEKIKSILDITVNNGAYIIFLYQVIHKTIKKGNIEFHLDSDILEQLDDMFFN